MVLKLLLTTTKEELASAVYLALGLLCHRHEMMTVSRSKKTCHFKQRRDFEVVWYRGGSYKRLFFPSRAYLHLVLTFL